MKSAAEIRISAAALRYNVAALGRLLPPDVQVALVVKANAYGHGLPQVVPILEPMADAFQVDDLDELARLRELTQARVLVFGFVPPEDVGEAIALDGELCVYSREQIEAIQQAAKKAKRPARVHLKVDCLLGRLGVLPSELSDLLPVLEGAPQLELQSVYGHYANIEDTDDPSHALKQEAVFEHCFTQVRRAFPRVQRHLSATSGLMARERTGIINDMVRLGIGVYGLYPSGPLAASYASVGLKPVMSWVSRLAQVKTIPAGHPVGYGLAFIAGRPMPIGIVPQGYSDGYSRSLSGVGEVLVAGKRCKVLGRVAMNMFAVDLSSTPYAKQGDEVVLLGSQRDETVTAEELAEWSGTINYEVVARISPLLPRRVV
ncbi:MAG: alanine racemase [Armatimonadetes bacterium]|nr:alanine racemase [Armatimonadota bacterium]